MEDLLHDRASMLGHVHMSTNFVTKRAGMRERRLITKALNFTKNHNPRHLSKVHKFYQSYELNFSDYTGKEKLDQGNIV